jgi:2-polyprenyl-6-hydroxyphenyl methylase/3-demethylubiquinone-9 3-methyltransferase
MVFISSGNNKSIQKYIKMQKVPEEIYNRIDNDIYNKDGNKWWQPDFSLNLIKTLYNPFRIDFAKKKFDQLKINSEKINVLEVGCGGGILSEEIAKLGFITTGIDPSEQSLNIAISHAKDNNLKIKYQKGTGENLPFQNSSFDVVFCCDVMEHVRDLPKVISEISRVLKPGGVFLYDTFNRTFISKLTVIKILQEWKRWAIMPSGLHVWEMFIRPEEIKSLLEQNELIWKEHIGIRPSVSVLKVLRYLRKRAEGKLTYEEFGEKFQMSQSEKINIMYMGYALKKNYRNRVLFYT